MKLRITLGAVAILVLAYLCDDISLRYHIPKSRQPLGTVTVEQYDAIPEKNGKVEFDFENPVAETCVRSLVPHLGYPPCWYLSRHAERRINY
jgi:hypothetical protein